ncbi:MAG: hypothetical protein ACLT8Y_13755 [Dorea formicigenerans]
MKRLNRIQNAGFAQMHMAVWMCQVQLKNSCNSFFYEVGYRLSLKDNGINSISQDNNQGDATNAYYSSELGLQKLSKYAQMFGLGTTSEWKFQRLIHKFPMILLVPSAIGRGNQQLRQVSLPAMLLRLQIKEHFLI